MGLFLPSPGKPPLVYSADEEGQYRLAIQQVLRRIAALVGRVTLTTVTVTTNYQVTTNDDVVRGDTTGGNATITLQPSASVKGQILYVKKVSTDGNTLTVASSGSEAIDAGTSLAWTTAYQGYALFANGTGWDIL